MLAPNAACVTESYPHPGLQRVAVACGSSVILALGQSARVQSSLPKCHSPVSAWESTHDHTQSRRNHSFSTIHNLPSSCSQSSIFFSFLFSTPVPRNFLFNRIYQESTRLRMPSAEGAPRTLYDKVFQAHVVDEKLDGTVLLYIGMSIP